ncbi:MAG: tRNA pseudouridine(13) synthase TruD [Gammaproteobacteria bacterium]
MDESFTRAALAPPRAFGAPLGSGRLRVEPEDFQVDEDLGFEPSGAGSHVLLKVRKRNANTEWVARELARAVGCKPFDVGYAGLKDRRAVATQWFTVPLPRLKAGVDAAAVGRGPSSIADLAVLRGQDFEVLEAHAHAKKLPRGALAGNRFTIRVRDLQADDAQLTERFAAIARAGVPNYFGPQRFGREGANLRKITRDPNSVHPRERTYVLSAARSLIFNAALAERVADGTWCQLEAGDVANLDARGSVFPVDAMDDALRERAERLDLHPTGPMWGRGELLSRGRVQTLEQSVGAHFEDPAELVIAAGMRQERRSLRLTVRNLEWHREGADAVIRFWLTRGSFATTVLSEVLNTDGEMALAEEGLASE